MTNMRQQLKTSQTGMVSILICMIMMIVITLVVLGFSQISRNELNQALNRQLSASAFYAANSGINNATAIINNTISTGGTILAQTTTCKTPTGSPISYTANQSLSSTFNVSYTCVTVNPVASTVKDETVFPLQIASGGGPSNIPITAINFNWQDITTPAGSNFTSCPGVGTFKQATTWSAACAADVLEVNIIPIGQIGTLANLESSTKTFYLYPKAGGAPAASSSLTYVYPATCTTASGCTASIPYDYYRSIAAGDTEYYVRVTPLYEPDNTTFLVSVNDATENGPPLYGAQALIDATGDSQGVLQRLEARVPLSNLGGVPDAIQTGNSLCKLIDGYPGTTAVVGQPTNASATTFPYDPLSTDPGCSLTGS